MGGEPERRRLIFVSRAVEVPPRAGAPIRTHRLLRGLAETFDTTLLTFAHGPDSPHEPMTGAELQAALPGVEVVTAPGLGGGKRLAQARSLLARSSYEWGRYRRAALRDALHAEVARRRPAVVHFDDVGVGLVGPVAQAGLNVLAAHNVEHRILTGTARAARGARRPYALAEARKISREEHGLWRAMDLCVAVSGLDAAAMRAGGARRVVVCPNGADPVEPLPAPRRAPGEPVRLLFVGTGGYWPNEHALAWFVGEVLPLVQRDLHTTFDVIGEPPRRPAQGPGVVHHGRVADLRGWYERADVVVVPLHHGSGTRLKVVEAMALGRPVVSTTLGAEGLPVRAPEHFLAAEDPEAFAAAIVEVARDVEEDAPELRAMIARARAAVADLTWPALTRGLAQEYERGLSTAAVPPPLPAPAARG